MQKVDSTGTFTYRRDGVGVTDPVLNDSAAEYTPGISESRGGTSKFYHSDRLGTTTKITDTTASVTDTRQYDAFGLLMGSTGTTPTPFGFVGKQGYQEDLDTGLKLLGHRYYDPSAGRFLTRDIARDGRNWYSYAKGAPERFIDSTGRFGMDGIGAGVTAINEPTGAVFNEIGGWTLVGDAHADPTAVQAGLDAFEDTLGGHPPSSMPSPGLALVGHFGLGILTSIIGSPGGPGGVALATIALRPVHQWIDRVNGMDPGGGWGGIGGVGGRGTGGAAIVIVKIARFYIPVE